MEEYLRRSKLTGLKYNIFDPGIIRILNMQQVAYYISQGLMPLDIYVSKDKNDKNILVYLYDKTTTHDAYESWCKGDLA